MKPLNRVKIAEEKFATPDNKRLMIRAKFKRAVNKILTKLQAYHLYEKIKRNKQCTIPLSKIMKDFNPRHKDKFTAFSTIEDSDEDQDEEGDHGDSDDESNDLSENERAGEMFGMSGRSPDSPVGSVKRSITNRDKQSNGTVDVHGKRSESGKSRDVDKPPASYNKKKKNEVTPIGGA
jgi:hypothetical protein